jgi:hypothetical protein
MALKEFKRELDIFNEHHLHDILHQLHDSERYYIGLDNGQSILNVEGYEPIEIDSLAIDNGFMTDRGFNRFTIDRLNFSGQNIEVERYRNLILEDRDGIISEYINKNLLYLIYESKILIINMESGDSWKIDIHIDSTHPHIITYKDFLMVVKSTEIYVINKDGSYNVLKFDSMAKNKVMRFISRVEVANNSLYILSGKSIIIIISLLKFSSKIVKLNSDEFVRNFYIANNGTNTVLVYDRKVEIYGPNKFTLKCEDFIPSDEVFKLDEWIYDPEEEALCIIETNMNKNKTKLIVLMSYDSDSAHCCLVIYNLVTGKVEKVKYINQGYDTSDNAIGFLDIGENQSLHGMGSELNIQNSTVIESKLLKTYKF